MILSSPTRVIVTCCISLLAAAGLLASGNKAAPEFVQGKWINTPDSITMAARKGKVTVVEFWTFACINCRHNLPSYERWYQAFHGKGVEVIGIHTPELDVERVTAEVERHVKQYGITYPVLLDNDYGNWKRWNQRAWPAVYLVDKKGEVRYHWEGELNYGSLHGEELMTQHIEQLLAEQP